MSVRKLMVVFCLLSFVLAVGCRSESPVSADVRTDGWRSAESPLINAHRGSRHEFDDNAAEGFAASLKAGVRGFETDIRFTKDDELVIMHDKDVSRTTTGTGDIHDMTAAEVTALTLRRSGFKVPTARRLMEVFRGVKGIRVEFEMKESAKALGQARGELYCRKLHDLADEIMEPGTYAFTSFSFDMLETMKRLFPDAPVGAIVGKPLTRAFVDRAAAIGCIGVAPLLNGTTKEAIDYAHAKGMVTTPWMVQTYRDYAKCRAIGGDTGTSDFAMGLLRKVRAKRRLVCLDLDATLCQHRSPVPEANFAALKELMKRYKCVMVGAGNAPRIHRQMGNFPIDVIGNYGMQEFVGEDGNFRCVRAVTNTVDRRFFREKTDYLRKKYGYTEYEGEPLEFHTSGMVTFGLLGTAPSAEHKVKFDPDRKKRKAMYKEVCEIFRDYSVFIGGSTSFDFAGKEYNKYDAIVSYARRHGYALDEIVFVGDDFGDGGGDSHVRIKGMDYIEVEDYRDFPRAVSVLLDAPVTDKPGAPTGLRAVAPAEASVVPLLNARQKAFLAKPRAERVALMASPEGRKELNAAGDRPVKVTLAWECLKPGVADVRYAVRVVKASTGEVVFETSTRKTSVELDNLEIACRYDWTAETVTKGGEALSCRGCFFTEPVAPRLVRLDGVPNMRDLGGRTGLNGRRVRQGMIYRSAGLNNNAGKYYTKEQILAMHKDGTLLASVPEKSLPAAKEIKSCLDAGKPEKADFKHLVKEWVPGADRLNDRSRAEARKTFGIRTDIDLRTDRECYGMTGSPLGPDVKWVHVSSSAYGGMASTDGKAAFAKVFRVFLDRENYPIDFHCIAGADRTGAVGYILGALLGYADEDLWRDWETTAFQNRTPTFNHAERFEKLVAVFDELPGKTTREKVEGYVKSLGFSDADIARFRAIMFER